MSGFREKRNLLRYDGKVIVFVSFMSRLKIIKFIVTGPYLELPIELFGLFIQESLRKF